MAESRGAGIFPFASSNPAFSCQGSVFWKWTALLLGAISLFRGIRLPNIWSATLLLVNYDQGFVKRGFLGATFGRALHLEHYANFCLFSYGTLALLAAALIAFALQSKAFRVAGSGEPVAIFATSFAVAYLGHLVGYLDIVLACLTVGLLLIRNSILRFALGIPVSVVGLLIHEMFLLVFLPVLLLSFAVDANGEQTSSAQRRTWSMAGVLALVSLLVDLRLALRPSLTSAQALAIGDAGAARADYSPARIVFTAFQLSAADNLHIMRDLFLHDHRYLFLWIVSLASFALFAVPIMLASGCLIRAWKEARSRQTLFVCALIASLSPLLMNVLGFDNVRWNALACLETFLVFLLLSRALGGSNVQLPPWYRSVTILLLALGMASGEGLMDEKEPHAFPFVTSTMHLVHATMEAGRIPPPHH